MEAILREYSIMYERGLIPITQCARCGFRSHMPRTRCPRCGSTEMIVTGHGEGTVYSYTIIERGIPTKSIVVLVDLGGVKVKGNYVGNLDKLRIGLKVRVTRRNGDVYFVDTP